jgi:hypothetical protein
MNKLISAGIPLPVGAFTSLYRPAHGGACPVTRLEVLGFFVRQENLDML